MDGLPKRHPLIVVALVAGLIFVLSTVANMFAVLATVPYQIALVVVMVMLVACLVLFDLKLERLSLSLQALSLEDGPLGKLGTKCDGLVSQYSAVQDELDRLKRQPAGAAHAAPEAACSDEERLHGVQTLMTRIIAEGQQMMHMPTLAVDENDWALRLTDLTAQALVGARRDELLRVMASAQGARGANVAHVVDMYRTAIPNLVATDTSRFFDPRPLLAEKPSKRKR